MFRKFSPIVIILIFNLWIWKVFESDILLGLLLIAVTVFLWILTRSKKKISLSFLTLLLVLTFYQWQTTERMSLTLLTNDEQRLQQVRLRAHPSINFSVGEKVVWIPTGNWFELRKEAVAFYKIKANFAEIMDPNLYFFANHPRERVGVKEFEKFPYILLPVFIIGFLSPAIKNQKQLWLSLLPALLIGFIGNANPSGPFVIFPFITVITAIGLENALDTIAQMSGVKKKLILTLSISAFFLVFIQIISYAKY